MGKVVIKVRIISIYSYEIQSAWKSLILCQFSADLYRETPIKQLDLGEIAKISPSKDLTQWQRMHLQLKHAERIVIGSKKET